MMLTNKQKSYLRAQAHHINPLFQVGKDGCTYNLFRTIEDSLAAHELLKVALLKTCPTNVREVAIEIAANTNSTIVQIIGRTIILYRPSKNRKIILP